MNTIRLAVIPPMLRVPLAALVSVCIGCMSTTDLVDYRAAGPIDFQKQNEVTQRWAGMKDANMPPPADVEVFQDSTPDGLLIENGMLRVLSGAPYKVLGNFRFQYYKRNFLPSPEEAVDDLKRLAASAGGNLVICSMHFPSSGTSKVGLVGGFIVVRHAPKPPAMKLEGKL